MGDTIVQLGQRGEMGCIEQSYATLVTELVMGISHQPSLFTFALIVLFARLALGLLFAAHGTQKLFGWFRGAGLANTAAFFEQIGFRPGRRFALAAGLTEL